MELKQEILQKLNSQSLNFDIALDYLQKIKQHLESPNLRLEEIDEYLDLSLRLNKYSTDRLTIIKDKIDNISTPH